MTIQTFRAVLEKDKTDGRTITARAVPYGETIEHGGRRVQFDDGSLRLPDGQVVPLTVDHGNGSMERIGRLLRWFSDTDAAYAELAVSETTLGSDVLTLLEDGVLTDVSIGVAVDEDEFTDDQGVLHRSGILDHVSIVGSGAFGKAGAGSKVLAVHSEKEPEMAEMEAEATAPAVAVYDDSEMRAEIVRLTEKIDSFNTKVVKEPELFQNMKDFVLTMHSAGQGDHTAAEKMQKSDRYELDTFAMSNDDTTTAAGLVPNFLSTQILGLLEGSRPGVEAFGTIDPGDYGMSVVLPDVTTEAAVAVQSNGGDQPNSTEMVIATKTFALETYAGANRVNVQLIERSSPAFVDRLFQSLVSSYATVTDAAFVAALVAGVGTNTAVLADMSASASATYAAVLLGVTTIASGIKRSADRLILGSAPWGELMSNLDSEDRPLVTAINPRNAQGSGNGTFWEFDYSPGLKGIFDPHAAAQTTLIAWSGAAASIEVPLPRLSVSKVEFASMDLGIIGLFTDAIMYGSNGGGLYSLTAA